MKLLIFIHSMSAGGAERVTANLANYWAERGHAITIVTMAGVDQDFYELHPAIERLSLNMAKKSSGLPIATINNLKRVLLLRRVLRNECPDIALAMMVTANCLLGLAARGTGIPAIGSERIHPPGMPLGLLWEWLRRTTYGQLAAVTALTTQSAGWLQKHTRAKRIVVIQNPVAYPLPVNELRILPGELLPPNKKLLLAVGRLALQKGFDRLLAIFADLAADFPQWNLAIVGDGPDLAILEKQAKKLGLTGRVVFPGRVGNVGDWYWSADLYVMTSRFEGFPNTLVEAMAYGLPAVSVDCETGPRDIIRHGIDGLLVPQGDSRALTESLAALMGNVSLRSEMGNRAVETRERFSLERIASQWEQLFRELR